MSQFGIGIITTGNRELHPNLLNLITEPTTFHVYTDYERRGPAYGRNECIKALTDAGCDYIALFDDDTYPIASGWQNHCINVMETSNVDVIGYPDPTVATLEGQGRGMDYWRWCTGCFTMISRRAVEEIGYYNPAYKTYGHEDIAYLFRARRAGLAGFLQADASPTRIAEFVKSEDIYGSDRGFNPTANMSVEAKKESIAANQSTFEDEVFAGPNFYPYTQGEI